MGSEEGLPGRRCPQGPPRGRERSAAEGKGSKGAGANRASSRGEAVALEPAGGSASASNHPSRRGPLAAPRNRPRGPVVSSRTPTASDGRAGPAAGSWQLLLRPRCPAASWAVVSARRTLRPCRRRVQGGAGEPRVTPRAQPARCLHPPPALASALRGGAPVTSGLPLRVEAPPPPPHTDRLREEQERPQQGAEAQNQVGGELRGDTGKPEGGPRHPREGQELTPAAQSGICSPRRKDSRQWAAQKGRPLSSHPASQLAHPVGPLRPAPPLPMGSYGLLCPKFRRLAACSEFPEGVDQ